jgi:hypothetical protein
MVPLQHLRRYPRRQPARRMPSLPERRMSGNSRDEQIVPVLSRSQGMEAQAIQEVPASEAVE